MPLSSGTRFGPYEILAPLGAGGMGEVYRAKDTKLDREVAIKVLPAAMAHDRERLARFEREAKVLASLNHPNIAQIYGLEDQGDTRALVMELVAGATLNVPQPLDTALNYAKQIADALEAAHEKGITHRDLKPANIMITPEGVVKVLDFGLASITAREASGDPENSPTLTMGATQAGVIMGTAAYMSPEQAAGKPIDKRSDIWSFGAVLWEMLTGARLFDGETVSHTLADVLRAPIDLQRVKAAAPVAQLVTRCLDRNIKTRLQAIGEARIAIQNYQANPIEQAPVEVVAPKPSKIPWLAAAVATLAATGLAVLHFTAKPAPGRTLRYSIAVPEGSMVHGFSISPDGRLLVMAVESTGESQLWLRPTDALEAQPIPSTKGASLPFWSPDSQNIGFFAGGKLKRIAAAGGPPQSLCDVNMPWGASWSQENVIVFSGFPDDEILQVSAKGGTPTPIAKVKGIRPVFLPDGRHFLYLSLLGRIEDNGIRVASLDGVTNQRILADVSSVAYAPRAGAGHLLFIRENTLMAVPFDASAKKIAGEVFPVAGSVGLGPAWSFPATASDDGLLLYNMGSLNVDRNAQIQWLDRAGKLLAPVGDRGGVGNPSLSPDEKYVAYRRDSETKSGQGWDIWVRDLARGTEARFTSHASMNGTPFWSPKGDQIVFESNREIGSFNLFRRSSTGDGQDEKLLPVGSMRWPTQWSNDGKYVVYNELDPKNKFDIWVLPMENPQAERKPVLFLGTEFNERLGQISPDGRWMTFTSDRSGTNQVYVRPFPKGDGEWTVSVAGGFASRWRADGKELFFLAPDGKLMAAAVKASQSFEAGVPVALFDARAVGSGSVVFDYDVTSDGKRFLIATASKAAVVWSQITVVTNWDANLSR